MNLGQLWPPFRVNANELISQKHLKPLAVVFSADPVDFDMSGQPQVVLPWLRQRFKSVKLLQRCVLCLIISDDNQLLEDFRPDMGVALVALHDAHCFLHLAFVAQIFY